MNTQHQVTFGNYTDKNDGAIHSRITLSYHAESLNQEELWEKSIISAQYLSAFWGLATAKYVRDINRIEHDVRYITGELFSNVVKFGQHQQVEIEICHYLPENELRFYVTSRIKPGETETYQAVIQRLLTEDPSVLFVEQMERSAEAGSVESGMGYLTMMIDYQAILAWKFEKDESGSMVTTLARLPISGSS